MRQKWTPKAPLVPRRSDRKPSADLHIPLILSRLERSRRSRVNHDTMVSRYSFHYEIVLCRYIVESSLLCRFTFTVPSKWIQGSMSQAYMTLFSVSGHSDAKTTPMVIPREYTTTSKTGEIILSILIDSHPDSMGSQYLV